LGDFLRRIPLLDTIDPTKTQGLFDRIEIGKASGLDWVRQQNPDFLSMVVVLL
jgi:hypothetical protein